MVIIGEYTSKVTAGNRIAIPRQFAKDLGKNLIVTRGFEQHLILVNQSQFHNITEGVVDKQFIQAEVREVTRYLLGSAFPIKPDAQGRFVVPERLHTFAGIQDKVVFLGLGTWVEIWDETAWQKHSSVLAQHSTQLANRLVHLGKQE